MLSLKAFKIPEDGLLNPHILASSNNINSNHLVYISSHNLRFLQSKSFPLLQIQNLELKIHTLVFSVEINEEYLKNEKVLESIEIKIFLSPEVFHFLRLKKGQEVSLVLMNTVLPIRNYEPNSLFNYFPVLPIAKRVYLTNLKNKNSSLLEKGLIKALLKRPFLAYVGMEFSVSLSSKDASKEILYEYSSKIPQTTNAFLDYKRQKNFYKLCLSSNNGIIPIDLLNFRINMVQYIHNSEERISRNVSSKPEESYFLVHFAEETELFIENYIENSYIQYPLLRQINVLKEEILKRPSLKALRRDLTREMGLNNLALNNNYYKSFLLIGKKGSGKKEVLSLICRKFGLNYFETDAKKISSLKSLEKNLKKALNLRPVLVNIRNFKALLHVVANKVYQDPQKSFVLFIKDFLEDFRILTKSSVDQMPCHLLFSCDKFDDLDPFDNEIKNLFDFLIKTKDFNLEELENLWETCLKIENMPIISELATISKGIPWKNIIKIYEKNKSETGTSFSYENLKKALENFKKNKEFDNPSIPNVKWEDVGGLIEAKNDIIDTIMLPQQYPQIFNEFMRPRTGLLFYGPPGTGKTLLAKCIATECKLNFLSVKGPELLNMYIGESEKNVREIFEKARKNPPCIIFFDELDALAPKRGMGSDSSNVMDRIVAQFLTELDGVNKEGVIYVIGATNRPDLLDESLLRAGRFDKKIYLGINEDEQSRIKVLQAQTRKLKLSEDVNFHDLNELIPVNFTGADFYGLTSQSVLRALKRRINEVNSLYKESGGKEGFNGFIEKLLVEKPELADIKICQQDFEEALNTVKPSVSLEELKNYQNLKEKFVS